VIRRLFAPKRDQVTAGWKNYTKLNCVLRGEDKCGTLRKTQICQEKTGVAAFNSLFLFIKTVVPPFSVGLCNSCRSNYVKCVLLKMAVV
jgi:hypothetical protein